MATNNTKILKSSEYFFLPGNKMAALQVFLPQDNVKSLDLISFKNRVEKGFDGTDRKHFHAVVCGTYNEVAFFDDNVITYYFNTQTGGYYYDIYKVVCLLDRLRDGWKDTNRRWSNILFELETPLGLPDGGVVDRHISRRFATKINGLRFEVETPSGIIRPSTFGVDIAETPAKVYFWHNRDFAWLNVIKSNAGGYDYTIQRNLIEIGITKPGEYSHKFWRSLLGCIYTDLRHMSMLYNIAINHMSKCGIAEPRIIGDEIKDESSFFEAAKADYETNIKPQA